MRFVMLTLSAAAVFALGCSSSDTTSTGPAAEDTGSAEETAVVDDTGTEEAAVDAASELKAPTLDQLMKMSGALHIMWTNNQVCDSVVGERKTATTDYKQIFSVPGTVNNKMDGAATADTDYTYRLRCKVGTTFSPYSNELTKNPTK